MADELGLRHLAYLCLGDVFAAENRLDQAEEAYRSAMDVEATPSVAYLKLSDLLKRRECFKEPKTQSESDRCRCEEPGSSLPPDWSARGTPSA